MCTRVTCIIKSLKNAGRRNDSLHKMCRYIFKFMKANFYIKNIFDDIYIYHYLDFNFVSIQFLIELRVFV